MERPNIVCVSIDSVRADYCSFIGDSNYNTTPFLQSLAEESTVFSSAISPSIWTFPVHASIFTGLYPPEHGLLTGEETLGDQKTFAECLVENGYSTRAFHRNPWLDTGGLLRGFESEVGGRGADSRKSRKIKIADSVEKLSPRLRSLLASAYDIKQRKIEPALDIPRFYRAWSGESSVHPMKKNTGGRETIQRAKSELNNTDLPFCWFTWLGEAHWKYKPPNPYHRSFTDRSVSGLIYNYVWWQNKVYGSRTSRLRAATGELVPPPREVTTFKNLYKGGIEYCDALLRELVAGLKDADVWDNTVFIVFGDHGEGFGDNDIFGHHFSVDDSLIHVPLLIRDPTGRLTPGEVSEPVSLLDIYSTILGLANVSGPESSSVDLAKERREFACTYYDVSDREYYTKAQERGIDASSLPPAKQYAIWKSESEKVINFPNQGEYIEQGDNSDLLRSQLDNHIEQLTSINSSGGKIDASVADQLRDMGYLHE